jgi:membrane associated rhomboid family serine protease
MAVCYRHPSRETGVSCSNCGRPICPDCMTATPVGMRCPECARQKTQVRRLQSTSDRPVVTMAIIAICVLTYFGMSSSGGGLGSGGGRIFTNYALYGPAVAEGEWWRLITSGFLHGGLLHLGFNMYILWFLGNMLEPSLGPWRFGALYFASLLAGSFGVMLAAPDQPTLGASGAVFGLMAAAFVFQRARGVDPWRSGLGPVILFNLALPFLFPNLNISIAAHIGGLVGGAIAALAMEWLSPRRRGDLLPVLACVAVGAVSVAGAISFASG